MLPELASLRNCAKDPGEGYRCNYATKLRDHYSSPDCLFELVPKGDELIPKDDAVYAIRNIANNEYFNHKIGTMKATATDPGQYWRIAPVLGLADCYTIQNVFNGEYMTKHAGSLYDAKKKPPGKDEYWEITSRMPDAATSSWMTDNWQLIAKQRLDRICMPGSHDSGTFEQTMATKYGSVDNTRTQLFNIGIQLRQGVRVFDLRPVLYINKESKEKKFYTAHWSKVDVPVLGLGYQGALGAPLDQVFDQIRAFAELEQNKGELIILNFSHFLNWDTRDSRPDLNPQELQAFSNLVQEKLGPQLVRSAPSAGLDTLRTRTVEQLISPDKPGRNNVIALSSTFGLDQQQAGLGLWNPRHYFPVEGEYSDTNQLGTMVVNQKEEQLRKCSHANRSVIFELCWQLTLSNTQSAVSGSILDLAAKANPALSPTVGGWIGKEDGISNEYYPNVINTDACEESVTKAVQLCLAICRFLNR